MLINDSFDSRNEEVPIRILDDQLATQNSHCRNKTNSSGNTSDTSSISSDDTCWDTGLMSEESDSEEQITSSVQNNFENRIADDSSIFNSTGCSEQETEEFITIQINNQPKNISSKDNIIQAQSCILNEKVSDDIPTKEKSLERDLKLGDFVSCGISNQEINCGPTMQCMLDSEEQGKMTFSPGLSSKTVPSYSELIENMHNIDISGCSNHFIKDSMDNRELVLRAAECEERTVESLFDSELSENERCEEIDSEEEPIIDSPTNVHHQLLHSPTPFENNIRQRLSKEVSTCQDNDVSNFTAFVESHREIFSPVNRSSEILCSTDEEQDIDNSIHQVKENNFSNVGETNLIKSNSINCGETYAAMHGVSQRKLKICEQVDVNNNEGDFASSTGITGIDHKEKESEHLQLSRGSDIIVSDGENKSVRPLMELSLNSCENRRISSSEKIECSVNRSFERILNFSELSAEPMSYSFPMCTQREISFDALKSGVNLAHRNSLTETSLPSWIKNKLEFLNTSNDKEHNRRQETYSSGTLIEPSNSSLPKARLQIDAGIYTTENNKKGESAAKENDNPTGVLENPKVMMSRSVFVDNKHDSLANKLCNSETYDASNLVSNIEQSYSGLSLRSDEVLTRQTCNEVPSNKSFVEANFILSPKISNSSEFTNSCGQSSLNCKNDRLWNKPQNSLLRSPKLSIIPRLASGKNMSHSHVSTTINKAKFDFMGEMQHSFRNELSLEKKNHGTESGDYAQMKSTNILSQLNVGSIGLFNQKPEPNMKEFVANNKSSLDTGIYCQKNTEERTSLSTDVNIHCFVQESNLKNLPLTSFSDISEKSGVCNTDSIIIGVSGSEKGRHKSSLLPVLKPPVLKLPQKNNKETEEKKNECVERPTHPLQCTGSSQCKLSQTHYDSNSASIISQSSYDYPKDNIRLSLDMKRLNKNSNIEIFGKSLPESNFPDEVRSELMTSAAKINNLEAGADESFHKSHHRPKGSSPLLRTSISEITGMKSSFKQISPLSSEALSGQESSQSSSSSIIKNSYEYPSVMNLSLNNKVEKRHASDALLNCQEDGHSKNKIQKMTQRHSISDSLENSQGDSGSLKKNSVDLDNELQKKFEEFLSGSLVSIQEEYIQSQQTDNSLEESYVDDETLLLRRRAFYI
ncbi:hypothetical protein AAG570_000212 [Ranatra chinensis]|uniref:Uncharacterized protein n=1 Tax=Ranatra chinensis TaxID=642074 RepID=A0ABD0YWE5_9HEMI